MDLSYRPHNQGTLSHPHVFNRFVRQFMDPIDWSFNKGRTRKSHVYINTTLATKDPIRIHKSLYLSVEDIESHFQEDHSHLYYTNKPNSKVHLICLDVDHTNNTTQDDLNQIRDHLLSIFPNSYWDYGSSGQSLNFFLLVSTETVYNQFFLDISTSTPLFINRLFKGISDGLRPYLNSLFPHTKFDSIKGTLGDYDYFQHKGRTCYRSILHSGTFAKLPRPGSIQEFHRFYDMPMVDTFELLGLCSSLDNRFLFSLYDTVSALISMTKESFIQTLEHWILSYKATSFDFPSRENKLVSLPSTDEAHGFSAPTEPQTPCPEPILPLNYVTKKLLNYNIGTPATPGSPKNHFSKPKKKDSQDPQNSISCAFERSIHFGLVFFRTYYKQHQQLPSLEEFRKQYRLEKGTGDELPDDQCRLQYVYTSLLKEFKPEKLKKDGLYIGRFMEELKQTISNEEITRITQERSSYRKSISYEDLDAACCFYYLSLTGKLDQKEWCGKELTIAQNSMVPFFQALKEKGLIQYSCNKAKVKALKEVLLYMGWLECVDLSYCSGSRARRYVFTPKFPRYKAFEQAVGKDLIEQWTRKTDPNIALEQVPKKTG